MLLRCNRFEASATATARLNNWLTVALVGTLVGLVAGLLPFVGGGGVGRGEVAVGGERPAGDKLKSCSPPIPRPLDASCESGLCKYTQHKIN